MNKQQEAVKYMISVWDEVQGNWRNKPDHVQKMFIEAENETLNIVVNSLPSEEEVSLELEEQLNNLRKEPNEPFNVKIYIDGYKDGFINRDLIYRN